MERKLRVIDNQSTIHLILDDQWKKLENYTTDVLFIVQGNVQLTVEAEHFDLHEGSIHVVNKYDQYEVSKEKDSSSMFLVMEISDSLLSQSVNPDGIKFTCDSQELYNQQSYDTLREMLYTLIDLLLLNEEKANFLLYGEVYSVLNHLVSNFAVYTKNYTGKDNKIREIVKYIHNHYYEEITLNHIAEQFYLDAGYFSKFFKKHIGVNYKRYVTNIRLYFAERDLRETDNSIAKVATDNGFSNVTSFNQEFKKYHKQTPSQYRNKHVKQLPVSAPDAQELSKRYTKMKRSKFYKEEGAETYRINLNNQGRDFIPIWRKLVNCGDANIALKEGLDNFLAPVLEKIPFESIRITSLFSEEMLCDWEKGTIKNFDRINELLDYLVAGKTKPWIVLNSFDYMSDERLLVLKPLPLWKKILKRFIEHVINRYDLKEVKQWRFEIVLNDLGNPEEITHYSNFFRETKHILRQVSPAIQVGGPTIKADYTITKYTTAFEQIMAEEFDFYSFMIYPYNSDRRKEEREAQRITDADYFYNRVQEIKKVICKYPARELYITEWNITVSNHNIINDTLFRGCFFIKNITQLLDLVDGLGCYSISDLTNWQEESSAFLYGGAGLVNKYGFEKPSFSALRFLDELCETRVVTRGKQYLLFANDDEWYILLFNYEHPNQLYYLKNENDIKATDIEKFFSSKKKVFNLSLQQLVPGDYEFRIFSCNRENGNIFGLWQQFSFAEQLRPTDLEYLRNKNVFQLEYLDETINSNAFQLDRELEPNEFSIIHFRKVAQLHPVE